MIRGVWTAALWLMPWVILQAQSEKSLLDDVLKSFRARDHEAARKQCEEMLSRYPGGANRSAGALLLAKSQYRTGRYRRAHATAQALVDHYPSSRYADEASWVASLSLLQLGQTRSAWTTLTGLRSRSNDVRARVDSQLATVVRHVPLSEAMDLISGLQDASLQEHLYFYGIDRLIEDGRLARARRELERLSKSRRKSTAKKASDHIKALRNRQEGRVRIGVITSLSGGNADAGEAVRRGLELAVGQHNATTVPRIELVICDDQSDILQAVHAARDLVQSDGVSAIIGPIDSDLMAAVSVVCDQARVPVISPTASKKGLSDLGLWVFQANPDLPTRSEALAAYAVDHMKGRRFAILAPSDLYGDAAIAGFSGVVERLGGRILAVERFYENTQDFRSQLIAIRRIGIVDSLLDGRTASLSRREVDSVFAQHFPPSADRKEEFSSPMTHIDALYLPVYSEDIKYIAPQIAFYNIRTQLLGGDQWFDLTELRLQQNYVNGVVFVSESFVDPMNEKTKAFLKDYKNQFGQDPKPEAIYSYDLMQFMIRVMTESSAYTADEIRAAMSNGAEWVGVHNRIVWSMSRRANQSVHILKFLDGHIFHEQ